MYPVLVKWGSFSLYSYGAMIALGASLGVAYLAIRGKRELGLTFDQANSLFLYIFIAAFVGGKFFLLFEDSSYLQRPSRWLAGRGFVFYGSFLFAIPTMLWFFRKHKLPTYAMLDIMAITTCLVHMMGRIGCFLAGCCHGKVTDSWFSVVYTDAACSAQPLNTPLYPTQLMEAFYIFLVMLVLFYLRSRRAFYGQLFLLYLILYGIGRFLLEYWRGDEARGYVIQDYVSNAQTVALCIVLVVMVIYRRLSQRNKVSLHQKPI